MRIITVFMFFIVLGRLSGDTIVLNKLKTGVEFYEEVIIELYSRAGIEVELKDIPIERALISSNSGMTDGELVRALEVLESFPNLVAVPTPITDIDVLVYFNNENFNSLTHEELKEYTIAIVRGITAVENYSEEFDVKVVKDLETLFRIINNNRLSIGLAPELFSIDQIHSMGFFNIYRSEKPLFKVELYHMLNKKHEDLISKLENVLIEMISDGTIDNLRKKYILE